MELSAIIKANNLTLTRPESDLVARLSPGISAGAGDLYDQRMKALAAARDLLKQLPDRKTLERQRNMEKAAMLKDRLKMLRQMIPFMSPSAVKSLNAEMKQIAAQLASLAGESGGGSGGSMPATAAPAAEAPESASNAETAPGTAQVNETDQGNDGAREKQHASSGTAMQVDGVKGGVSNAEDRQLKETVEELKSLYNTVLAALKRKRQQGRVNGQLPGHAGHLRVYADMTGSADTVSVKV